MMKGRLIRLSHPTDDDFRLMEQWFSPDSESAAFTGGSYGEYLTADAIAELVRSGRKRFFIIRRLSDDKPVGAVDYQAGASGHMVIGGAIFDSTDWQQGYAADAFVVLIDYLFHLRDARLVQTTVGIFNKRSLETVARAGFTCEGILRERMYLDGRWHDAVSWSMLRSEYYAKVERDSAMSERWQVQHLVPEEDKARARRALAEHLRSGNVRTSIAALVAAESDPADGHVPAASTANGRSS